MVCFHLYEISRIGKSINTGSRLVVARGLEEGRCELRGEGQSKVYQAAKGAKDTPGFGRRGSV